MGLQGCCGCFNLRDGSRAIGITLMVLIILRAIGNVGSYIYALEEHSKYSDEMLAPVIVNVLLAVGYIVFNGLLLHAVSTESYTPLLAWMIFHGIVFGVESVGVLVVLLFSAIHGWWSVFAIMVGVAVWLGFNWYWFAVVEAYYQELRRKAHGFVYIRQGGDEMMKHGHV